jgi:hypothetical protein
MMKRFVYVLVDPNLNIIRYVGISYYPLERYKQHLRDKISNRYKAEWIAELKAQGQHPRLEIIGAYGVTQANEKEIELIRELRNQYGALITNIAAGGDSVALLTLEEEMLRRKNIAANKRSNDKTSNTQRTWIAAHPEFKEYLSSIFKGKSRLIPGRQRGCKSSEGLVFASVKDAAQHHDMHPTTITYSLTNKIPVKGILFTHSDIQFSEKQHKQRPVKCVEDGTTFLTIKEAARHYNVDWGTVKRAVDQDKPFKGIVLKYTDEIDEQEFKKEYQIPIKCSDGKMFSSVTEAAECYRLLPDHISYGLTHCDVVDGKYFHYEKDTHKTRIKGSPKAVYGSDGSVYTSPGYLIDALKCRPSTVLHKALSYDRPLKGIRYSYTPFEVITNHIGQARKGAKPFSDNQGNTFVSVLAASLRHKIERRLIKKELENDKPTRFSFTYLQD